MRLHNELFPDDYDSDRLPDLERSPFIHAYYFNVLTKELLVRLDEAWEILFSLTKEDSGSSNKAKEDYFCYQVLRYARYPEVHAEIFETGKMNRMFASARSGNQAEFIRNWRSNAAAQTNGVAINAIGGLIFFLEAMLMPVLHRRDASHPVFRIYSVLTRVESLIREFGESVGVRLHRIPVLSSANDCPYMTRDNVPSVVIKNILGDLVLSEMFTSWGRSYFKDADRSTNDMVVCVSALGYTVQGDGNTHEEKSVVITYNDVQHLFR